MAELDKLDRQVQTRLLKFFRERVNPAKDPRQIGKALKGRLGTLWRFRVGDYRAICFIDSKAKRVLVLKIGHRREIYD
jgi:mRNA interferase RelE/StbE